MNLVCASTHPHFPGTKCTLVAGHNGEHQSAPTVDMITWPNTTAPSPVTRSTAFPAIILATIILG